MTIFLIFTLGTILGSFFGLIIDRLPEHSIVSPRSHCENCGQILIWKDLIPIISQLINCASCRYCKIKLTYWYSILELSCGTLFVMVWLEKVDLTFSLICLASFLMVGFDLKTHAFPLWIWLTFFVLLSFTCPFNIGVLLCILIAIMTEFSSLKIGSGDWLYLSLVAFSANFFQLTLCLFVASLSGLLYYAFNPKQKKAEMPFLPFLFLSYLCHLFLKMML